MFNCEKCINTEWNKHTMAIIKMATINWILEFGPNFEIQLPITYLSSNTVIVFPPFFFSGKKISFKWYKYKEANFTHVIWPQNDMTMALCKTRSRVIDKGNSQGIDSQGYVWLERRGRGCLCNFLVRQLKGRYITDLLPLYVT